MTVLIECMGISPDRFKELCKIIYDAHVETEDLASVLKILSGNKDLNREELVYCGFLYGVFTSKNDIIDLGES